MNTTDEHYAVIFTSGATAAQKLVGECFPWSPSSEFCHTMDNHTSILGIREYVRAAGAQTSVVDHNSACQCSSEHFDNKRQARGISTTSPTFSLYAFPAESNFSGRRYDLSRHLKRARSGGIGHSGPQSTHTWKVLVDAAKYCATSPLDLSKYDADFVTISLYKIFGYPTGLGCLVVRRDALSLLRKPYFGGGTVDAVSATDNFLVTRAGPERFEDGTLNFLAIESALVGFSDVLGRRPLSRIAQHLEGLFTIFIYTERDLTYHHRI
jgi:molybdenum cofactor sulfurtransferase